MENVVRSRGSESPSRTVKALEEEEDKNYWKLNCTARLILRAYVVRFFFSNVIIK